MPARTYIVVYLTEIGGEIVVKRMTKIQIQKLLDKHDMLPVEGICIIEGNIVKGFGVYRNLEKILE